MNFFVFPICASLIYFPAEKKKKNELHNFSYAGAIQYATHMCLCEEEEGGGGTNTASKIVKNTN